MRREAISAYLLSEDLQTDQIETILQLVDLFGLHLVFAQNWVQRPGIDISKPKRQHLSNTRKRRGRVEASHWTNEMPVVKPLQMWHERK